MILFWMFQVTASTLSALLLATVFGKLTLTVSCISMIVGALWARRQVRAFSDLKAWRWGAWSTGITGVFEKAILYSLVFVCLHHFAYMLFEVDGNLNTRGLNNFGDLPLHINYIKALANGLPFPPVNPIFALEKLRYPMGIDFYNSLWEVMGVQLNTHLFIVGIFFSIACLVALRAWASWWGLAGFFFSGGFAGWSVLSGAPLIDFQTNVDWKNLFTSVLITQRGFLFALPVGLFLMQNALAAFNGKVILSRRQQRTLGVLWGGLAFFHLHTFFIVSLLIAGYLLISTDKDGVAAGVRRRLRENSTLIFRAIPLGALFVFYSTGLFQKADVVHWKFGWQLKELQKNADFTLNWAGYFDELLRYVWINFVPLLVLLLILVVLVYKTTRKELKKEYTLYLFLFILFFNLMLAKWDWDNIKVLIWPYLGFMRIAYLLMEGTLPFFVRGVLTFFLFFSGALEVYRSVYAVVPVKIYSKAELAKTEGALQQTDVLGVFASAQSHDHPIGFFGRIRAVGYEGHLWSHGIDYTKQQAELTMLMQGQVEWEKWARNLGVRYIFWGPLERQVFGDHAQAWKNRKNVSRVPGYEVYDLTRNP